MRLLVAAAVAGALVPLLSPGMKGFAEAARLGLFTLPPAPPPGTNVLAAAEGTKVGAESDGVKVGAEREGTKSLDFALNVGRETPVAAAAGAPPPGTNSGVAAENAPGVLAVEGFDRRLGSCENWHSLS